LILSSIADKKYAILDWQAGLFRQQWLRQHTPWFTIGQLIVLRVFVRVVLPLFFQNILDNLSFHLSLNQLIPIIT
jgi:hypothetical protein